MFSHSKILFFVPLLFVTSIPTCFLNFLIFFIILVCLLFIHVKDSPTELYHCTCTVLLSNHKSINQSIHINLSAGAQNITDLYNLLVCRRLLTMRLHGKAAV